MSYIYFLHAPTSPLPHLPTSLSPHLPTSIFSPYTPHILTFTLLYIHDPLSTTHMVTHSVGHVVILKAVVNRAFTTSMEVCACSVAPCDVM